MYAIFWKSFLILLLLVGSICLLNEKEEVIEEEIQYEKKQYYVEVSMNDVQKKVELEEYLLGVLASEMPYTFEKEALKAQCVAARTYIMQRGLKTDGTTKTQVYKTKEDLIEIYDERYEVMKNKLQEVIDETRGEVLVKDGKYISALFYSCNNGESNDASWYYQNEVSYLKRVDSFWDKECEAYLRTITVNEEDLCKMLEISNFEVGDVYYYENGYIKTIDIGGTRFTGREVREKLQLRSSCFTMRKVNGIIHITTRGFGHGVGLSQYGANGMAKEGYDYKEILLHYYTGVELKTIY